jgi:LysM repeat protein
MRRKTLFLSVLMLIFINSISARTDSIGIKTIDGADYIIHKVEKGQGLFSISQRYNTTVKELKEINANVDVLQLDQEILIPLSEKVRKEVVKIHVVEKGQTLYRISKIYQVGVEDIKRWNNLSDNAIKDGDELKIILDESAVVEQEKETEKNDNKEQEPSVAPNERVEEGIATYIEDPTISSRKALALHKSAPIGTVIQVTNLMNGQVVYVKVVGNLSDNNAQSNEIIKLSKYTAKKLKIRDQITRVRLNYFIE